MYLFDPARGKARRTMIRDKARKLARRELRAAQAAAKDLKNRTKGMIAEARASDGKVPDEKLAARVRSEIGHAISHPGAIHVDANSGTVQLSGNILASEMERLIEAVWKVRGVEVIEHQIETHQSAEGISELQGEGHIIEQPGTRGHWRPSAALAVGVLGGLLAAYGVFNKSAVGKTLGTVGMAMLAKGIQEAEPVAGL